MKTALMIALLVAAVIAIAGVGYFVTREADRQSSNKSISSGYGYNPNYADALQLRKPELCKDIEYALQSGPTDNIEKLSGQAAIEACEQQALVGYFGCECDSDATLNAMRVRE